MNKLAVGVGIGVAAAIIIGVVFAVSIPESSSPETIEIPEVETPEPAQESVSIQLNESIGIAQQKP